MDIKETYNFWAEQYDTNENKTRDLEAKALRTMLNDLDFNNCLEIGCGTGKNTEWLQARSRMVYAVDFSEEMLAKAKIKVRSERVIFIHADINQEWNFSTEEKFDLVTFSLVLEHIDNLDVIFEKISKVIKENGYVYIGELHPFKQYNGSRARFETEEGILTVTCFEHHISDFTYAAKKHDLLIHDFDEFFDDDERTGVPRILSILFKKSANC